MGLANSLNTPSRPLLVGLAGQQNAGKSTCFNMLTGASQHVANYPGVTVDKKTGSYRHQGSRVTVVDLPGTYSLSSFSLEERVARDFLLLEKPDAVVNVVDASALQRSLSFTVQLLEMEMPLVVALNMMDVAGRQGVDIDVSALNKRLGVEVIPTVGRKRQGKEEIKQAVAQVVGRTAGQGLRIDYGHLEAGIVVLAAQLAQSPLAKRYPARWLTVRLVEGDAQVEELISAQEDDAGGALACAQTIRADFERSQGLSAADYLVGCRSRLAAAIVADCVRVAQQGKRTLTERIDRVVLNRFAAPFFLVATVFIIYQLSIVQGYELTQYWWPILARGRAFIAALLPDAGLLVDPPLRSMALWMVDSANGLLNYIPVFLILFSLVAILEDSGYMARIAFLLDKIFHAFGLHGQSTLPFILGGVFAGGCAVPGVMATKGIPDERSRMATILTVPYMNCLAKIPFYTLLVNVFFVEHKSWVMFFLSTITIFIALLVARLLTATLLRSRETAPFVMAMPTYHAPTFFGVGQRVLERTWQYIKKVGTIVVAVSVCVFTLLQFPRLSDERMVAYNGQMAAAVTAFSSKIGTTRFAEQLHDPLHLLKVVNLYADYKTARFSAGNSAAAVRAIDANFASANPDLFILLKPGKESDARQVNSALRALESKRKSLRRAIKEAQIGNSVLGMVGRALEPVTRWAGFNWKINIAILSSFVARESSVATIGVLYQQGADENRNLEQRMGSETENSGFTPLHALAVMVFFALYPPCLATTIMIKVQTGSSKWMLFSMLFPTALGFLVAIGIFTGGSALGLTGIQMMALLYGLVVCLTIATYFTKKA